jgi:hypothetical protein
MVSGAGAAGAEIRDTPGRAAEQVVTVLATVRDAT